MDSEKNRKKILFVSDFTFTHTIGWTEVATARLINGMATDDGYEVYLFAGKPRRGFMAINPHPHIRVHRFLYTPFPGDKGFNNFIFPNLWRIFWLLRSIRPDVVHFHVPSPFDWIVLIMVRRLGIPTVYTSHMFSEHFFPEVHTPLQRVARHIIDRLLARYMRSFDLVIHPSATQRDIVERSYWLSWGLVISNGFVPLEVDISRGRPSDWINKTVFFTVSRLSHEKNLSIVIDAFDRLHSQYPYTLLVIVWDGVDRESLEKYAHSKASSSAISFLWQKREYDLAEVYQQADIFVAASSRESEGLTVLEAISFGKPIILSDASGNAARQFLDKNGFSFRDRDINDLVNQMQRFLDDPWLIKLLGERGFSIVEPYRFEYSLQRFKDTYERLISSSVHSWKIL